MSFNKKKIVLACISSLLTMGIAGCSCQPSINNNITYNINEASNGISLSVNEKELLFGERFELTATYEQVPGAELVWTSSNENVAKVINGTVLATGVGEATITATYNNESATCLIRVNFGGILPQLYLPNIANNMIGLGVGSTYEVNSQAFFNGGYYDCETCLISDNPSVVSVSGNVLTGVRSGSAIVKVIGSWNEFVGSFMQCDLVVNVTNDVILYNMVTVDGKTSAASSCDLSIVSEFEGKTYINSAKLQAFCKVNGVTKQAAITFEDNGVINLDDNGNITTKNIGSCKITASYDDNGVVFVTSTVVNVTCPIAIYDEGRIKFSCEEDFPVESVFGAGAKILSARQGDTELTVKRGKRLEGIVPNGSDTLPIQIETNKGGYVFNDLFVYTKVLNSTNFLSTLLLTMGKINRGYYILEEDITTAIDMTSQVSSQYIPGDENNSRYFAGTFDGQLHTVKVKVGPQGVFGGFGESAVVKNVHFEFDFNSTVDTVTGIRGCGLARNEAVYHHSSMTIKLDNCYFTAKHFKQKCYMLFGFKICNSTYKNIYVDLTKSGSSTSLPAFTNRTQEIGLLYNVDPCIYYGTYNSFRGAISNFYVVSDTTSFYPMACGKTGKGSDGSDNYFVCYAKNDAKTDGSAGLGVNVRHQGQPNDTYCLALFKTGQKNLTLFGHLVDNLNGGANVAYVYESVNDKADWGIYRFNDNASLKGFLGNDVTSIGDWPIKS